MKTKNIDVETASYPGASSELTRKAAQAFRALGTDLRVRILLLLADRRLDVGQLHRELGIPDSTVDVNIGIGRRCGLWHQTKDGQRRIYHLTETGRLMAQVIAKLAKRAD